MKNTGWGRGGGLNREGGLINFPPMKRGGLFERGGLIEDLRYITTQFKCLKRGACGVVNKITRKK